MSRASTHGVARLELALLSLAALALTGCASPTALGFDERVNSRGEACELRQPCYTRYQWAAMRDQDQRAEKTRRLRESCFASADVTSGEAGGTASCY